MKNVLGFVFLLSAVACESDTPREYVGTLDGADSRFGLAIDGDRGSVYVCGGEADRSRHHQWWDVVEADDAFVSASEEGAVSLVVDDDVVRGTITIEGETFDAVGTRAQGVDGLFEADRDEGDCQVGVVVSDGGTVVQGVFCPPGEAAVQVIPIDDIAGLTEDGFDVEAKSDPPVRFSMTPVFPGG